MMCISMNSYTWQIKRDTNRVLGKLNGYDGDAKTDREYREAKENEKRKKIEHDRTYIIDLMLFAINDASDKNKINVNDIFNIIKKEVYRYANAFNRHYVDDDIFTTYQILQDFIDKYYILFDNYTKNILKEIDVEICNYFKIEYKEKFLCKIFGHSFVNDKYSIFNNGKRRCKRCNKWEE